MGAERVATTVESSAARKVPSQMLDITKRSRPVVGSEGRGMDESEGSGWRVSVASMSVLGEPLLSSGLVSVGGSLEVCCADAIVAWLFCGDSCKCDIPKVREHMHLPQGAALPQVYTRYIYRANHLIRECDYV